MTNTKSNKTHKQFLVRMKKHLRKLNHKLSLIEKSTDSLGFTKDKIEKLKKRRDTLLMQIGNINSLNYQGR